MKNIYYLFVIALLVGAVSVGCRSKTKPDNIIDFGLSLMEKGEYESARETLSEAVEVCTNSVTAYYNLGLACWKLGDNAAAVDALTKAVDYSDSSDIRPLELLAYVLIDSGNALGAGKVLSNIDENTARSLTIMALASERAGSSDLARSYLAQAIELDQYYPPALYNLALLHRDVFNDSREALAYYKRFKEVAPSDIRADESPESFINQSGLSVTGQSSVTADHIEVAPLPEASEVVVDEITPEPVVIIENTETSEQKKVKELIKEAKHALAKGDVDVALITLKTAVKEHSDSPEAIWALAKLYGESLGNKSKANELYKKFSIMFPNDARTAEIMKEMSEASAESIPTPTAPVTKKKSGDSYFRDGLKYYNNKEWDNAIVSYTKGLKLAPKSPLIAYNLGLAYKAKGDLKKAATSFRLSLQIMPDKPNALYMLGLTEMELDHNDIALARLNRLLRIKPDFAKAHHLLGLIYCEESRPGMTVVHFERFLHLAPNDPNAAKTRVWLDKNQAER